MVPRLSDRPIWVHSSLLFTGGGAALHPYAGLSSLCAGKAALRMWVLTLAEDLSGTGIRVGTVTVHGRVERGTAFDPDDIAAALGGAILERITKTPDGRWYDKLPTADVDALVAYLKSPRKQSRAEPARRR